MSQDNEREFTIKEPKPGTRKAVLAGCKCPILDNNYGRGRGGNGAKYGWVVNEECPIHGTGDATSFFSKENDNESHD